MPPRNTVSWRPLLAPGLAALIGCAILVGLGIWQLERKSWKEGLIAAIDARAYGEAVDPPSPASWPAWQPGTGEYQRVRLAGTLLNDLEVPVHGIAEAKRGQGVFGFYVFTPLRQRDDTIVFVNRGFVPVELKDAASRPAGQPSGPVTVTGLARSPEVRGAFVPANDPARREWFVRDLADMARADGLARVAPFYVDADATPNPGGYPLGGQTRLTLPNDHLNYAFTWFGLALTLAGVFTVFARRRLSASETNPTDRRMMPAGGEPG